MKDRCDSCIWRGIFETYSDTDHAQQYSICTLSGIDTEEEELDECDEYERRQNRENPL